jgi:Ran GTPase-activating protein (RanGAP) involved in mRNA processing and transport
LVVKELQLSKGFTDAFIKKLPNIAFKQQRSLQKLDLSGNHLTEIGIHTIQEYLENRSQLRELNLKGSILNGQLINSLIPSKNG